MHGVIKSQPAKMITIYSTSSTGVTAAKESGCFLILNGPSQGQPFIISQLASYPPFASARMNFLIAFLALCLKIASGQGSEPSSSVGSINGSSSAYTDTDVGFYSIPGKAVDSLSYMVGLRISENGRAYCAGALVAPRWVLTTFNCATLQRGKKGYSYVWDGQYASIGSTQVSGAVGGERIGVSKYFGHPDYNKNTRENDYGLLKLEKDSAYKPVALAPDGVHYFESAISGSVYGWEWSTDANTFSWSGLLNSTMHWASDCHNTEPTFYASEFCAIGDKTTDACHINEGSPIVIQSWGKDTLVGMLSYNPGCNKDNTPALFARTSKGQIWITNTIESNA